MENVTAVAGASNGALYDADGTVFGCGQNVRGDLGDGRHRSSATPVRVRHLDGHAVKQLVAAFANSGALLTNGKYYDWGYNAKGQLGIGHAGGCSDVPVRVRLPMAVRHVAQGGSIWFNGQTLVMLSDGSLWAWGADDHSQLGDGRNRAEPSPIRVKAPAGVTYSSIATGSATSYAISTTGSVYAWGVGFLGQVGDGRRASRVSGAGCLRRLRDLRDRQQCRHRPAATRTVTSSAAATEVSPLGTCEPACSQSAIMS